MPTRDHEKFGLLVNPDLTFHRIVFDLDDANQFLGPVVNEPVHVAFERQGAIYDAFFSPDAKENRAEPNPVASMAKATAATDNPRFLQDPTAAISGPVIFLGRDGHSIDDEIVEAIKNTIRAVRHYKDDNAEEFELWRNAVLNLGSPQE
ncbi:hypothetical protein [Corynebacterium aquatimens]|uniref:Uncharacterized protein n=1 Tax=Corynebacterium aquatimens TaxID=1190508 RepID=A0A931E613_9CORY|nr:hypothetical protein [Corynebacterium aquatimens]MBG6123063.1 hypothetical protein [Corynebacterium aquatimens]WJY66603.1 hypothetical protein CAQUA_09580 [Corynebacterium aquatimens]